MKSLITIWCISGNSPQATAITIPSLSSKMYNMHLISSYYLIAFNRLEKPRGDDDVRRIVPTRLLKTHRPATKRFIIFYCALAPCIYFWFYLNFLLSLFTIHNKTPRPYDENDFTIMRRAVPQRSERARDRRQRVHAPARRSRTGF